MEKKMIVEDLELSGAGGGRVQSLCRSLSLRAPDPSSQLAAAYRNQDLATFTELLSGSPPEVDPDHWYDDPNFATMLDLASRDEGRAEYARVLLAAGADPNRVNRVRKKTPLHLAAEVGNATSLQELLADPRTDVNKQDNTGSTPLHLAAREDAGDQTGVARAQLQYRYRKCVQLLMEHPRVELNKPNRKGLTPVHLAAQQASADMVRFLLALGGSRLDVDTYQDAAGETARQVVAARHPQLARMLPPRGQEKQLTADTLFFYLYSRETGNFLNALAGGEQAAPDAALLDADDGSHTLLQLACEAGLHDVATELLAAGADPNKTLPANRRTPLYLACLHGYYRVARTLCNHERTDATVRVNGETALHAAVKGSAEAASLTLAASRGGRDHHKCVDALLKTSVDALLKTSVDVNASDAKGNTALHYAVRNGDNDVLLTLLRNGASIGVRNTLGQPPLADISPRALEAYLDECVGTNDLLPREDNYEVVFKYHFLAGAAAAGRTAPVLPLGDGEQVSVRVEEDAKQLVRGPRATKTAASETDSLLYMSRSADLRYLLKHPIITSFLYLKWQRIRAFFFINLAFYVLFWLLLTAYILAGYSEGASGGVSAEELAGSATAAASTSASHRNASDAGGDGASGGGSAAGVLAALLGVMLLLLLLRELFQLLVSPRRYVASPENWMEVFLIVVTAVLLFSRQTNSYSRQQLSAIAILLSWAELVLLIGRHPLLATNIEMFKTVTVNFLKFLAWYSILIVAFALSFYTLFRDCGTSAGCKESDEENFFLSPGMSVFKSIVMLTGEFDAGSIPFVFFPGTSHVLFVLFVFLIAIVLFNLLNGLAVSDTQAIREDAELVAYVSRVNLVAYVESMLVGQSWACLTACQALRSLTTRVNLFPDVIPDRQIHVLPNQGNRIEFKTLRDCAKNKDSDGDDDLRDCATQCRYTTMDPAVMRDVRQLFLRRGREEEAGQLQALLHDYKQQLQFCRQRIEHLERNEKTLLDLLAKNPSR